MYMHDIGYYYTESGGIELILTRGRARVYPWHMHVRHWTVGVVRAGSVQVVTEAQRLTLYGGQHFFIRPYEPHSLSVAPESELLVLCFDDIETFAADGSAFGRLFPHTPLLRAEERACIEAAAVAGKEWTPLPGSSHRGASRQGDTLPSRSVQAVARLIMEKPDEPLRIEHMSAYAGYSPWHFLRAFQQTTGMTPHAFQLLCRVRLVRAMLRADTAAADLAVSAGFSDQSHMHKVFKRHHGMTPGEFRRTSFRLEP